MSASLDFKYEMKCRRCETHNTFYYGTTNQIGIRKFFSEMEELTWKPKRKKCDKCSDLIVHDMLSFWLEDKNTKKRIPTPDELNELGL